MAEYDVWSECAATRRALPRDFVDRYLTKNRGIEIIFDKDPPRSHLDVETCQLSLGRRSSVHLSPGLPNLYYPERLKAALVIIDRYLTLYSDSFSASLSFNLGDEGAEDSAFTYCSSFRTSTLMPDPDFLLSNGYAAEKAAAPWITKKWADRAPMAYWRGTDSGLKHYPDFATAPRVLLANISKQAPHLVDALITGVEPRANEEECRVYYNSRHLLGPRQPPEAMFDYKYQIDVDGNSNAWRGFFLKLLSGSPVFKVESELGFRQWYYDHLEPWVNFVPVAADVSDIIEKIQFLEKNPVISQSIAYNGRDLALSLAYESEVNFAAGVMLRKVIDR